MCTLRALYVISEGGDIVITRKYLTVEKRASELYGEDYEPIPSDWDLKNLLFEQLALKEQDGPSKHPILIFQNKIWPVIYVNKFGTYLVAIPLIEGFIQRSNHTPSTIQEYQDIPIVDSPYIIATFAFLESFASFIEPCAPRFEQKKIAKVQALISRLIHFGKPIELDYNNVCALIKTDLSKDELDDTTRYAWKPVMFHGKPHFSVSIVEKISAIQYDKENIKDISEASGTIKCISEIELNHKLSLLSTREESSNIALIDLKLHPSVNSYNIKKTELNLQCTPPLGEFDLCKYAMEDISKIPIRGFYQMQEISPYQVKILIQLKLQENVNNQFEYFNVEIPFPNRPGITGLELNPSVGNVSLHPQNRNLLIWNIGHKIASKNLEATLPGSIFFSHQSQDINMTEDPFLKGQNAYIKLNFKILDWNLSGLSITHKNISITPKPSTKIYESERFIISNKYIIWNSLGDVRHCENPSDHQDV